MMKYFKMALMIGCIFGFLMFLLAFFVMDLGFISSASWGLVIPFGALVVCIIITFHELKNRK